jgi:hypothetical protein
VGTIPFPEMFLQVGLYKIIRMVRLGECKIVSRFQTSIGQQKINVIKEKKILSLIKEIFLLNNMYHYF